MSEINFLPYLFILMISMEFCSPNSKIPANEIALSNSSDSGQLNVTNNVVTVNKNLNGFNTANLFHNYHQESDALNLIKGLNPRILRFPGGTVANFYHFQNPGYGYKESDLKQIKGNAKQNITRRYLAEQKLISSNSIKENFIKNFVELAIEANFQVLIVANLLNERDEDILSMISYFKENHIPIAGIELGNEYYFKAYQNIIPDVETYIAKSKNLTQKIRELDPNIPIGVVAAPSTKLKGITGLRKEIFEDWNRKLGNENFYDAFIMHIYSNHKDCKNYPSVQEKMLCNLNGNTKFIFEDVVKSFEECKEFYGDKTIWITEWNVKDVFKNLGNTFLQGIYYADFMLMMLDQPKIEIAAYHNLLAKGSGFNLIGQNANKARDTNRRYSQRAAYEAAAIFGPLFAGNFNVIKNKEFIKNELSREISISAFQEQGTGSKLVFIINKSGKEFNLGKINGLDIDIDSSISVKSVWSELLEMGIGVNEWVEEGTLNVTELEVSSLKGELIKGYSINRITIH